MAGVGLSISSIAQVAKFACKFGKELHKFSEDTDVAKHEIQSFANIARTFGDLVHAAEISLRKHCQENNDSHILDYIARHRVLDGVKVQSDSMRADLESATGLLNSHLRSQYPFVAFLKWTIYKDTILVLFPAMERIKTNLQLALAIVMLEVLSKSLSRYSTRQPKTDDDRPTERESLENLIASQMLVLNRLDDQLTQMQLKMTPQEASGN